MKVLTNTVLVALLVGSIGVAGLAPTYAAPAAAPQWTMGPHHFGPHQFGMRGDRHAGFGMTLPRFDLLAQLERSQGGIRMVELSRRLMVTTGNVTQLTDQLEKEGLAERAADPRNRRAFLIRLTPKGRELFAAMAQAHERWIVELFAGLAAPEKRLLFAMLSKEKSFLAGLAGQSTIPRPAV